jgi:ubiquinone/menaquinone biosynthesis C-methylase UbiE
MKKNKVAGGSEMLNAQDILENKLGIVYGSRVADLGCGGNGYFTFESAELAGESGVVYAVDILKMILKNIENRAKMMGLDNIKTVWSNLENFGAAEITDSSLDFALVVNVLFQNKHPEKIVREGTRMLKQEGKMLVIDWKEGRFPFGPKADVKIKHDEVDNLALTAGLKKIKDIEVGKFHYGILFEKI